MTSLTSSYTAFQLRTNPFSPEVTVNGQQGRFDYLQGPLSPQKDAMHLNYYFDLYRWLDPEQIGQIGQNGRLVVFPDRLGQPGMIIVISGVSGTGRTSLENLLLFEVETRAKSAPIHTRYTIEISANKVQAAQNFASMLISEIEDYVANPKLGRDAKRLPKKLRATVKEWRENLIEGETNTEFLFQQLTRDIRKTLPDTPIVFSLDASNHMNTPDTWRPACTMLRNLADYVILSLSKRDHASYLKTSLQDNQIRVVWIDAPRVDEHQTKRFLVNRLAAERVAPAAPGQELFPFTDRAVSALFAATGGGEPITLSIGVAIKKLKGAFDKKCADVAGALAGPPTAGVAAPRLQISDEDMRRYFSS
jgi:hypothetical protein